MQIVWWIFLNPAQGGSRAGEAEIWVTVASTRSGVRNLDPVGLTAQCHILFSKPATQ